MIFARGSYSQPSQAPKTLTELSAWTQVQLGNVARSLLLATGRTVAENDTALGNDFVLLLDATSGVFTLTFLPADQVQFGIWVVKRINAGGNAPILGLTLDGVVNPTLAAQNDSIIIWTDGNAYYALARS